MRQSSPSCVSVREAGCPFSRSTVTTRRGTNTRAIGRRGAVAWSRAAGEVGRSGSNAPSGGALGRNGWPGVVFDWMRGGDERAPVTSGRGTGGRGGRDESPMSPDMVPDPDQARRLDSAPHTVRRQSRSKRRPVPYSALLNHRAASVRVASLTGFTFDRLVSNLKAMSGIVPAESRGSRQEVLRSRSCNPLLIVVGEQSPHYLRGAP